MKFALTTTLLACLAGSAFAQETPPAPAAAAADTPDAESVKKAEDLLNEVAKTYKNAKALTDSIELKVETPMGNQTQQMSVTVGSGTDAILAFPGMSMTAVDGKLHFVRDDVDDKYFAVPLNETLGNTLNSMYGGNFPVPFQLAMRSEMTTQEKLRSMLMGMMQEPKLTGHKVTTADDGSSMHEVIIASDEGKGSIYIADASKLVQRVQLAITPEGLPPGMVINAAIQFSPRVSDSLDQAIAFNAGDRKAVDSIEELEPTPIAVGEIPPDFTLATLGGETVTLSKLQGSVVVMDFWATWCAPCRKGLPLLQEFATWAETSGQPIKVYAVNVSEREQDADERKAKVQDFWSKAKYTMPTLVDIDNSVFPKYGFSGIPVTLIVGPDGKVFKVHAGFSANMVDLLKKDVEKALKVTG